MFPSVLDFYVPVIDHFGDLGFALNLWRSLCFRHPDMHIRFFSEDRTLFENMTGNLPLGQIEYFPLDYIAPKPASHIFNFFDRKLQRDYLDRFDYDKMIVNFGYFLLHEGVESLHGTRYILENGHDTVIHIVPSLSEHTGGIVINPYVEGKKRDILQSSTFLARRELLGQIGIFLSDAQLERRWVSVFVYPKSLEDVLEAIEHADEDIVFFVFWDDLGLAGRVRKNIIWMPFLQIEDYGVFQSLCDANVVRGENSLCQGLISGKPTLWDIYKEVNNAHYVKIKDYIGFFRKRFPEFDWGEYESMMMRFNSNEWRFLGFNDFISDFSRYKGIFTVASDYIFDECDLIANIESLFQ